MRPQNTPPRRARLSPQGEVSGLLEAIRLGEPSGRRTIWICRCRCGREIGVRADLIKAKRRKSCGCLFDIDFAKRDEEAGILGARPVPIAPGYYAAECGDIYSAHLLPPWEPLRKLVPNPQSFGYLYYGICIDGRSRTMTGHKIVAMCFLPPRPSTRHGVRHKDDNPANNRADNLEWGTQAENIRDRDERGRTARGDKCRSGLKGEAIGNSKLTEAQVIEIRRRLAAGEMGTVLAREFGVQNTNISMIRTGKTWGHIG